MMRKIQIGTLDISDAEEEKVLETIRSGYLSAGPVIDEFEHRVAALHGKKYGIFVNSGQSALEVALKLAQARLGIYHRPLKVLIPTTTYAATLWAILNTGNTPVFCDISPATFCIDYSKADDDFDVALPVDLCGRAATDPPTDAFVIEDACEAVGNKKCNYGDIICLSFYVAHIITTGSGGMICLNDDYLAEHARSYITHGRKFGGDFTKYNDIWVDRFLFDKVGTSARGNALEAAFGLAHLDKLEGIIAKRKENAKFFRTTWTVSDIRNQIKFPDLEYIQECVFQFFPIILESSLSREKILRSLFAQGIDSRVLLSLTNQPAFCKLYGDIEYKYPTSKFVNSQGFIVGCHQQLSKADMLYVFGALEHAVKEQYQ